MIYPAPDKLDALGSKYALVIVAAKRARQIKERARPFVESRSTNSLTVALEEIASGQILPVQVGEPEAPPSATSSGPVLTGLVGTSLDDETAPTRSAAVRRALRSRAKVETAFEAEEEHDLDEEEGEEEALEASDENDASDEVEHEESETDDVAYGLAADEDDDESEALGEVDESEEAGERTDSGDAADVDET